jgi:hypothetical protein
MKTYKVTLTGEFGKVLSFEIRDTQKDAESFVKHIAEEKFWGELVQIEMVELKHIHTVLTGGQVPGAKRIAAWLDGNDESIVVEWWGFSGSFMRTEYDRRTCTTKRFFEPVGTENFERLKAIAAEAA